MPKVAGWPRRYVASSGRERQQPGLPCGFRVHVWLGDGDGDVGGGFVPFRGLPPLGAGAGEGFGAVPLLR